MWRSGCIDPHFLELGTSWRWVVSFTPRPLYLLWESLRYPLDRRLGWPQSWSGRRGEEKIIYPTGTRTPTPRSSSPYPVAMPTALSRLWKIYLNPQLDIQLLSASRSFYFGNAIWVSTWYMGNFWQPAAHSSAGPAGGTHATRVTLHTRVWIPSVVDRPVVYTHYNFSSSSPQWTSEQLPWSELIPHRPVDRNLKPLLLY
jgi:hypothetical protein